MGKLQQTGIPTADKKQYQRIYKRRYYKIRRANLRYLFCNICGGKYTSEHVTTHKNMKKHIRAVKYLEEYADFDVPPFENLEVYFWKD